MLTIQISDTAVSSAVIQALMALIGHTDEEAKAKYTLDLTSVHLHDGGTSPEIPWNDVQAIRDLNIHYKHNVPPLAQVPLYASQGYNKHYHSSDFDGGMMPGVNGIHDHLDNLHGGGHAYAVFYPSCGAPLASWNR